MTTANAHCRRENSIPATAIPLAVCLLLLIAAHDAGAEGNDLQRQALDCSSAPAFLHYPVYRIPVRVHLGKSSRNPGGFRRILDEINTIWMKQAGICFEMQVVMDDEPLGKGMDMWFLPVLGGGPGLNGYYRNDHNIQVRDTPLLGRCAHPAHYPAARTAAHELGHSLSLLHRQDSDDNLMRSQTYGWRLNSFEVMEARKAAAAKALSDTTPVNCDAPRGLP